MFALYWVVSPLWLSWWQICIGMVLIIRMVMSYHTVTKKELDVGIFGQISVDVLINSRVNPNLTLFDIFSKESDKINCAV